MTSNTEPGRLPLGLLLWAAFFAITSAAHASLPPAPPMAPVRQIVDTYYGVRVSDPYRYMENLSDPEVQAWMKAQNDYTRRLIGSISGRAKLLARIRLLDESEPAEISDVRRLPTGRVFYLKRSATEGVAKLYVRDGFAGKETLIADPSKYDVPGGPHVSISFYSVSQDGRYVTVGGGVSGGYLAAKVFDTLSGKDTGETVNRVLFTKGFVPSVWRPDSRSFFYTQLQALPAGSPAAEIVQNSKVYLHIVGTDPDTDQAVLGGTLSPFVKLEPLDAPSVMVAPVYPTLSG